MENDNEEDNESEKEITGFDTRFTYTREGLVVYDVHADIKMDKNRKENNGITQQDYNVFRNFLPASWEETDSKHETYNKFKSYSNALAPFSGLEFATEHGKSNLFII